MGSALGIGQIKTDGAGKSDEKRDEVITLVTKEMSYVKT